MAQPGLTDAGPGACSARSGQPQPDRGQRIFDGEHPASGCGDVMPSSLREDDSIFLRRNSSPARVSPSNHSTLRLPAHPARAALAFFVSSLRARAVYGP